MPLVEEDAIDESLNGRVKVGAVENDDRALPAQLERKLLPATGNLATQVLG